jgi:pimeloyl-ACP methyl ester carboxylesterase
MEELMDLVTVPSGQIATWRQGKGMPALVIHGGPGLSDYTDGLAAELASHFLTIRYQQRGLPPTTLGEPYTVEAHVSDAVALLDALGMKRAWAIGHSWGGHLAMHLAVAHPERLLGLVVIDGLGALGDGGEAEMGRRLSAGLSAEQAARAQQLDERAMSGQGSEKEALESLRIFWPHYFARPAAAPPMPPVRISLACYSATWASAKEHLARGTLERGLRFYHGRAVFIHGKQDPIPYEVAVQTSALIEGAALTLLEDCGHFGWLEEPGAVLDAILAQRAVRNR